MGKIELMRKESETLYHEIDLCISELIKARTEKDTEAEGKALFRMEGLMVGTMQHLSCVIDSLQDDSKVVKNDHFDELDKEIREYINAQKSDVFRDVAYHFANWQKQQDQETIELAEDHAMLAGMEKMKKEMQKKYVDIGRATVVEGKDGNEIFFDDFKKVVGDTFEIGDRLEIKAIKHIDKWTQQN